MNRSRVRDVILFSTADWDSKYWTNKQHIAVRLAERGYRVLYVETVGLRMPRLSAIDARRIATRLKNGIAPVARVQPDLWRLSPLTLPFGHRSPAVAALNSWQLKERISGWMTRLDVRRPLVWTYHPYMLDVADLLGPSMIVYHCADDLGAVPGISRQSYDAAERQLLERADVIFTTSHRLQQRCAAVAGARSHYFGNVADVAHFGRARTNQALPPEIARISRPRLGYVGALSDFKIDFNLLAYLAEARPDWQLVLIGDERPGQADPALARLALRANVHRLGWRPYDALPRYMGGLDVALLPQLINDYTQAMFPMKFFEYLAAGLPVVSTPLDAIRDFSPLHSVAGDPASFERAIAALLADRPAPLPLDHPVLTQNCWDARLDRMLAVVDTPDGSEP